MRPRIVVGIRGATGAVCGVRLLIRLRENRVETHLVATAAGVLNAHHELGLDRKALDALADCSYNPADVTLKERRRLVRLVRETPFNLAHLRNMCAMTEMGGVIFPPLPAFYHRPQTVDELVGDTVERVLALLGVDGAAPRNWSGL